MVGARGSRGEGGASEGFAVTVVDLDLAESDFWGGLLLGERWVEVSTLFDIFWANVGEGDICDLCLQEEPLFVG